MKGVLGLELFQDLLIEIGCEEIPTSYIFPALEDMKSAFTSFCHDTNTEFESVQTMATPRRLTLIARQVATMQKDEILEIKGPPAKAAVAPDGSYTKAATGFAASRGASLKDLEIRDTGKGEYLFISKKKKGGPTKKILPELLNKVLDRVSFPKSMRWGAYKMRFARPVRWVVFLFGDKPVSVPLEGFKSGRYSMGHRFLAGKKIKIDSVNDYQATLEENHVMIDHTERRRRIREAVEAAADGGMPLISDALLDDVLFLVEYPHVGVGSFDDQFLKLPREVLTLCIEKTQHYFPMEASDGKQLMPRFCVVMNMPLEKSRDVIAGYEKVLHSRLQDALFFYLNDLKIPLEQRVPDLGRIVFQKELGTLLDKTNRLKSLTEAMAEKFGFNPDETYTATRAAFLCKTDLTTSMVFEFTDLQGIVGKHYSLGSGETASVAEAIGEHYMPRFAEDRLPRSRAGKILALADKLDSVAGYFAVGLIPTGSEDPFSLRRQALGAVRILEQGMFPARLEELLQLSLDQFSEQVLPADKKPGVLSALLEFFDVRLDTMLEALGLKYDVLDAVDYRRMPSVNHIVFCAQALTALRGDESFQKLLEVFTRVNNIMKKSASSDDFRGDSVDESLLVEDAEKALFASFEEIASDWDRFEPQTVDDYRDKITRLYGITDRAHDFFDNVMVMAEDRDVRANRLALLSRIRDLFRSIADFDKIVKG